MAPTPPPSPLAAFPRELIARVVDQAARDAELTALILHAARLAPSEGQVLRLPADLLLEVGAASRLLAWESEGLAPHLDAGLPSARDALIRAFRGAAARLSDPSAPASTLSRDVFVLSVESLAWTGPAYLRAEILLDTPDEDALVEAMARFLWDRRHDAPASHQEGSP